jgi:hypothetical protein
MITPTRLSVVLAAINHSCRSSPPGAIAVLFSYLRQLIDKKKVAGFDFV